MFRVLASAGLLRAFTAFLLFGLEGFRVYRVLWGFGVFVLEELGFRV